ncbi:M1 family metallopeptidase [Nocardioides sp. cx-169]|uniref:M1 family metallopeptidase n=1 Tax=Nocardioides sp. cx-169 TaxID=2899080 RepID=UPI001E56FA39|nr:M1 family metallopeptidase [Nocardioides sp. cx-169]MCD4536065.1 M1 family metallopeptidase [Nocardioides sp. cx-169]
MPHPPGLRRRPPSALVAALPLLLLLLLAVPVSANEPAPVLGAAGIGDPYFPLDGNGGIDVQSYEVHDRYAFRTERLSGWTVVRLTATQALRRFNLDLLLTARSVTVDGAPAAFAQRDGHELEITPTVPLAAGQTVDVLVRYAGSPAELTWGGESNWLASDREVLAVHQPHMAAWWFPANDHPSDKALVDVSITAPTRKVVISNGERVGRVVRGGLTITRWRSAQPMAPYLAFFAIGPFRVERGTLSGRPWLVAVSKAMPRQHLRRSLRLMRRSAAVTRWLERQVGPYPFGSTGGVTTSLNPGFALETQGRPVYPILAQGGHSLLVHELAHQWFGNSVALERWGDIWLNEGAATFLEVRWTESRGGLEGRRWLEQAYARYSRGAPFWRVRLSDPGPDRLFHEAVYLRGAMTFQALRVRIGEDAFWRLLRTWVADHRDGNATSAQFEALAEQVSGQDLGAFFDAWLRARVRPGRAAAHGL